MRHIDRGELPGLVTAVYRRGDIRVDALGTKEVGGAEPMRRDTIFRISSMSKPITAALAMTLVDEGKLRLADHVARFLPELASRRVLSRIDVPLSDTVPANRPITVDDLLTFRMGFGIVWGPPDGTPIQRAANELHLGAFGPPKPQEPPAPDEWLRRFATLRLMRQPGERWMYNTGIEVLSVLLARAAGKPLDALLQERIFEPLGMTDTSFSVPASKLGRLATGYWPQDPFADGGPLVVSDGVAESQWSTTRVTFGAAGLVSTADDFMTFARMILGRGTRVLSETAVDAMTTDHLSADESWLGARYGDRDRSRRSVTHSRALRMGRWARDVVVLRPEERDRGGPSRAAFPGSTGLYRDFWRSVSAAS